MWSETAAYSYPENTSFGEITYICKSKSKKMSYLFLFGDSRLTRDLSLVEQNTFLQAIVIISFPDIITIIQKRQPIPKKLVLQQNNPQII